MKYLRILIISVIVFGSYAPFSQAYIYANYSNPVAWQYSINRDTGEKGFEYADYEASEVAEPGIVYLLLTGLAALFMRRRTVLGEKVG